MGKLSASVFLSGLSVIIVDLLEYKGQRSGFRVQTSRVKFVSAHYPTNRLSSILYIIMGLFYFGQWVKDKGHRGE